MEKYLINFKTSKWSMGQEYEEKVTYGVES